MGRYYWSKKTEADSLKKLQTWWLKKYGYLEPGFRWGGIKWTNNWSGKDSSISFSSSIQDEDSHLRLSYTQTDNDGNKEDFDYKIPLVTSPCYFGGKRYWFICPWYTNGNYCGRRVGTLYLGGKYFACRHCYDLSYDSRNENRKYKLFPLFASLSSMQKIEELEDQIKRRYYAGRPTRKQRKLDKVTAKMWYYYQFLKKDGEIK